MNIVTAASTEGGVIANQIDDVSGDQAKDVDNEVNQNEMSDNVDWEEVGKRALTNILTGIENQKIMKSLKN